MTTTIQPNLTSSSVDISQIEKRLDAASDLIESYLSNTAEDLPELDRALARGDVLKVASMAHRLKSAAATAGVMELSEAAARIEACYRKGAFEMLPFQVDAFRRAQISFQERDQCRRV